MESSAWHRKLSDIPTITHADIARTYGKYTKTPSNAVHKRCQVNAWIHMHTKSKVRKTSTLASGLVSYTSR